jgi:hypothetical protein
VKAQFKQHFHLKISKGDTFQCQQLHEKATLSELGEQFPGIIKSLSF